MVGVVEGGDLVVVVGVVNGGFGGAVNYVRGGRSVSMVFRGRAFGSISPYDLIVCVVLRPHPWVGMRIVVEAYRAERDGEAGFDGVVLEVA